jgi:hypothetical protein
VTPVEEGTNLHHSDIIAPADEHFPGLKELPKKFHRLANDSQGS